MQVANEVLDQKINNMLENNEKEHKQIMKGMSDIRADLKSLVKQIADLDETFPTRHEYNYVEKRISTVEGIIKGVGMAIGLAVLGALLKLVIL